MVNTKHIWLIDDDQASHAYHKIMIRHAGLDNSKVRSIYDVDEPIQLLKELNSIKDPNIEHKKVLEDIISELTLITRDPYLIITKGIDIEKIAPILELIDKLDITKELINSGTKIEGFRKSTIATLINNIIDNWGINLTINPARI